MAFDFISGAGAGASDALKELVAKQFMQALQQQQAEQAQQRIDLDEKRFAASEADRIEDRKFRQETRDRQDASDLIANLSPGEITPEQADILGKSPATKARVTPRKVISARRIDGTAPLDGSGPQEFNVLEPTQEQAERSFEKSNKRRIIGTLPPQLRQAQEAIEAGVSPNVVAQSMRDPQAERAAELADYERRKQIDAKYRPPQETSQGSEYKLIGPNGEQRIVRGADAANQLLGQGWKQYDAVAERASAAGTNMSDEALRTAQETLRVAKALRDHRGRSRVFGSIQGALPNFNQDAIDAESLAEQLTSLEALENMGKMKGVLSDKDIAVIKSASTRLSNRRISDEAAAEEIGNIISMIEGKLSAAGAGGTTPNGGGGLAPGTERTINGTPAVWDGKGWLPKGR